MDHSHDGRGQDGGDLGGARGAAEAPVLRGEIPKRARAPRVRPPRVRLSHPVVERVGAKFARRVEAQLAAGRVELADFLAEGERLWPTEVVAEEVDAGWIERRAKVERRVAECPLGRPVLMIQGEKVSLLRDDGEVACPWASCKHHNYLSVLETGSIKINFPDMEPHEIPQPCSLLGALNGEANFEEIAAALNLTRERIRQDVARAMVRAWEAGLRDDEHEDDDEEPAFVRQARLDAVERTRVRAASRAAAPKADRPRPARAASPRPQPVAPAPRAVEAPAGPWIDPADGTGWLLPAALVAALAAPPAAEDAPAAVVLLPAPQLELPFDGRALA